MFPQQRGYTNPPVICPATETCMIWKQDSQWGFLMLCCNVAQSLGWLCKVSHTVTIDENRPWKNASLFKGKESERNVCNQMGVNRMPGMRNQS